MSVDEAQQALEESQVSAQTDSLISDAAEISTNFTIGAALQSAAQQLAGFVQSQLPCAQITVNGAELSVTYGANPGNCTYNGHTFTGQHTMTVMRNAANEVAVHHEWTSLSNGHVSLSGSADVIWNQTSKSRHVTHQITYQVLTGPLAGESGSASGDRTQTALDAGITVGMRVDGTRSWDGPHGHFELDISGVEMRWIDPVPQAGSYELTTPSGKALSLAFSRIDADSIRVTAAAGTRDYSFVVNETGAIAR